jgi:hypothetical protein
VFGPPPPNVNVELRLRVFVACFDHATKQAKHASIEFLQNNGWIANAAGAAFRIY